MSKSSSLSQSDTFIKRIKIKNDKFIHESKDSYLLSLERSSHCLDDSYIETTCLNKSLLNDDHQNLETHLSEHLDINLNGNVKNDINVHFSEHQNLGVHISEHLNACLNGNLQMDQNDFNGDDGNISDNINENCLTPTYIIENNEIISRDIHNGLNYHPDSVVEELCCESIDIESGFENQDQMICCDIKTTEILSLNNIHSRVHFANGIKDAADEFDDRGKLSNIINRGKKHFYIFNPNHTDLSNSLKDSKRSHRDKNQTTQYKKRHNTREFKKDFNAKDLDNSVRNFNNFGKNHIETNVEDSENEQDITLNNNDERDFNNFGLNCVENNLGEMESQHELLTEEMRNCDSFAYQNQQEQTNLEALAIQPHEIIEDGTSISIMNNALKSEEQQLIHVDERIDENEIIDIDDHNNSINHNMIVQFLHQTIDDPRIISQTPPEQIIQNVLQYDTIEEYPHVERIKVEVSEEYNTPIIKQESEDIAEVGDIANNFIEIHMDISHTLNSLRHQLEQLLNLSLEYYEFWLQDSVQLNSDKSLVDHYIEGTGMVQINLEVKSVGHQPRINILDVLKSVDDDEDDEANLNVEMFENDPVTEHVMLYGKRELETDSGIIKNENLSYFDNDPNISMSNMVKGNSTMSQAGLPINTEKVTKWIVDAIFKKEQERMAIPTDPMLWTVSQVKHWMRWAIKHFRLKRVNLTNFDLCGADICSLNHQEFLKYVPRDKGDIFWTHLELLRKCKLVAILQNDEGQVKIKSSKMSHQPGGSGSMEDVKWNIMVPSRLGKGGKCKNIRVLPVNSRMQNNINNINALSYSASSLAANHLNSNNNNQSSSNQATRSGNNGQIQLWQFLLELLTDKNYREVITWLGDEGEFKLIYPEYVAQLWGLRKNKSNMNYEKLSRALRYYYDGDMIAKVTCKRFVYKFVCDLQMLIGYSAAELNQQVTDCYNRTKQTNYQP